MTAADRLARLEEIRADHDLYPDRDWHDHIGWLLTEIDRADAQMQGLFEKLGAATLRAEHAEAERDGLRYTNEILASGAEDLQGQKALFVKAVSEQGERLARVREAVNVFCHGEQAYAEHAHYCIPILEALDGAEVSDV